MNDKKELKLRIESFKSLKEDWDSYGSLPMNPKTLELGEKFLDLIPSSYQLPWVCPTSCGGLCFEWFAKEEGFDATIYLEGVSNISGWNNRNEKEVEIDKIFFDGEKIPQEILELIPKLII